MFYSIYIISALFSGSIKGEEMRVFRLSMILLIGVLIAAVPELRGLRFSPSEGAESDWPEATYLSMMSISYDTWVGGSVVFIAEALKPLSETDEEFYGTLELEIIEENPNGSAGAYTLFPPGVPISTIPMDEGSAMFTVMNTEAEFIGVRVKAAGLKPSMPMGIEVREAGDTPAFAFIDGFEVYNPELDEGPFFHSIYAVDTEGRPVTVDDADSFVAWVESEETPDGSALIADLMSGEEGGRVVINSLGGRGFFTFSNTDMEEITLGAAIYIGDEVLEIEEPFALSPVDSDVGIAIIPFPSTGPCGTAGVDYSLMAMAFVPETQQPDFDNSTSEISMTLWDITGEESASHTPEGWGALSSGVRGYNISNSEADSFGVFIKLESRGEPYLGELFKMPVPFYEPGRATRLQVMGPVLAFTGDTVELQAVGVDGIGTFDPDAQGFWGVRCSDGSYAESPRIGLGGDDFYTWEAWGHFAQTEGGSIDFTVHHNFADELSISSWDAEEGMYFDMGYLGESMDHDLKFIEGSYDAPYQYGIYAPNEGFLQTNMRYTLTITCNTEGGIPKRDHTGSVELSTTGGTLSSPTATFEDGTALVEIESPVSGEVTITAFGDFETGTVTVVFVEPGDPAGIYVPVDDLEPPLAGVPYEVPVMVWSPTGIVSTYSGTISVDVTEPDGDGSCEYPETIEIHSGYGSAEFFNSDIEVVTVTATAADLYDASYDMPFFGFVHAEHDEATLGTGDTFRLPVTVLDGTGEGIRYDGGFYTYIFESIDNGSAIYSPWAEITSGGCEIWITDTEAETLWVFASMDESEPLLPDFGHDFDDYYIGQVVFTATGIEEMKPQGLEMGRVYPNPFNSSLSVEFTSDVARLVSVTVYDPRGRLVLSLNHSATIGSNVIDMDFSGLPSGIYTIKTGDAPISAVLVK